MENNAWKGIEIPSNQRVKPNRTCQPCSSQNAFCKPRTQKCSNQDQIQTNKFSQLKINPQHCTGK